MTDGTAQPDRHDFGAPSSPRRARTFTSGCDAATVHLRHREPDVEAPEPDPEVAAIWRHDLRDAAAASAPVIHAPHASDLVTADAA